MVRFVKCPRCELNYIDGDKQEYCDICLKEMKGLRTDADEIEDEEEEELPTAVCPVCGENMMRVGERMCEECRKRAELETQEEGEDEEDDEWREYLDDDEGDLDEVEIGETFDDEFDDAEEEEEEYVDEEEDMEYVTGDEIYELTDDDDDEDEEDGDEDF